MKCTTGGGRKWNEVYFLVTCHSLFPFRPLQVRLYFKQSCEYPQWDLCSTDFVTDALG